MKQSAGKANNNVVVFAAGVVCAVVCMGAVLWACGVIDLGNTSAKADEIVADGDSPGPKKILEDTTDLSKMTPDELAVYFGGVKAMRIKRNPAVVKAAVRKLSSADVKVLCESFMKTPTGENLRGYAASLGIAGGEEAARALGTFYERDLNPKQCADYGIAVAIGRSGYEGAAEILIEAYEKTPQVELRKSLIVGMAQITKSERITDFLIKQTLLIEDRGELFNAIECIGGQGFDRCVAFLEDALYGRIELKRDTDDLRKRIIRALSFAGSEASVRALVRAVNAQSLTEKRRVQAVCWLGSLAGRRVDGAFEELVGLASGSEVEPIRQKAVEWIKKSKHPEAEAALKSLG